MRYGICRLVMGTSYSRLVPKAALLVSAICRLTVSTIRKCTRMNAHWTIPLPRVSLIQSLGSFHTACFISGNRNEEVKTYHIPIPDPCTPAHQPETPPSLTLQHPHFSIPASNSHVSTTRRPCDSPDTQSWIFRWTHRE